MQRWCWLVLMLIIPAILFVSQTSAEVPSLAPTFGPPTNGYLTSPFGPDHPTGVDIATSVGITTPVYPIAAGKVVYAAFSDIGFAWTVIIEHDEKVDNKTLWSAYAHMGSAGKTITESHSYIDSNIVTGTRVTRNTRLGVQGTAGHSTGTHLHFEMRTGTDLFPSPAFPTFYNDTKRYTPINPTDYIPLLREKDFVCLIGTSVGKGLSDQGQVQLWKKFYADNGHIVNIGCPTGDVRQEKNLWRQDFKREDGTEQTILGDGQGKNPWWMSKNIADKYLSLNGTSGPLGQLSSREYYYDGTRARRVDFASGSILLYPPSEIQMSDKTNGWRGEYFTFSDLNRPTLETKVFERYDVALGSYLAFDWGALSPDPNRIKPGPFAARWTGKFRADLPGLRTFYVWADNGVRLWVDGKSVIDAWRPQPVTRHMNTLPFMLGTGDHDLKLEYFHLPGDASMRMTWAFTGVSPVWADSVSGSRPEPPPAPIPTGNDVGLIQVPRPGGITPVPPSNLATATVLALDVSTSMAWPDPAGKPKIDGLKSAASMLVNMIRAESQTQGAQHQIALITFNEAATTVLGLTKDWDKANAVVGSLVANGDTNIAQAMANANAELQKVPTHQPRIILLLTDGVPTRQLNGQLGSDLPSLRQEILKGPVAQAAAAKNCIYTIGFGGPDQPGNSTPSYDPAFLRSIAQGSSCGQSYEAKNASELANVYVKFRHQSLGALLGEFNGTIKQGQNALAGTIDVPVNQSALYATLNWPGSTLMLELTDPKGKQVDSGYPGATFTTTSQMVYLIVQNPVTGKWSANVRGVDVPEGVTNYNLVLSARAGASPATPSIPSTVYLPMPTNAGNNQSIGIAVGVIASLLILGLIGTFAIGLSRQNTTGGAYLFVQSGQATRRQLSMGRAPVQIGRDPANAIAFPADTQVSRRHAEIHRESSGYVLYDLGSTNGTFVNEARVSQHSLQDGDQIRVGQSTIRFQIEGRS